MITNSNSKVIYNGDGSTTTFPYTFKIFQDSDLVVVLQDSAGNETTQTLNSDYTVTGAGNDSGGNVIFTTAPESGYKVIIYRSIPLKQEVDYVPNDPFPAETHEEALDRLTMIAQQLQEQLNRALLRDLSQSSGLTLPALVAGKYLYTDGSTLQWVTPSTVDYDGTISRGLDANKPSSPTVGDVYIATDTLRIYICKTAGSWSYALDITSAGADVDDAVSKKHTQNTDTIIKDTDTDTSIDTEETADSDTLVGKVAGVEVLRIHNNGIVDLPKQSGCRVYLGGANQSIPNGTDTKIQFNTESWDTQNEFDSTTNYRFTATKDGVYDVSVLIAWDSAVDQCRLRTKIEVNGVRLADYYPRASGSSYQSTAINTKVKLNAGDYIEIIVFQDSGSSIGLVYGEYNTAVEIVKLQ